MKILIALPFLLLPTGVAADERASLFRDHIRPILTGKCLTCHDSEKKKGGLDLTRRTTALTGGESGPAVVAGKPAESLLFEKVSDGEMPPKNPLTAEQVAAFRKWIEQGAPYDNEPLTAGRAGPDWWSLRKVARPPVPRSPQARGWGHNPIDAFVLDKLHQKGLYPSSEADRAMLIRRATFDLIGLPPTPEEVQSFVADPSMDAYERLIDRLLASPRYGERWGRHWLDVVRFGESHGYEMNTLRLHAWPYRDYVIRAFNRDTPFPQFVLEQLAADTIAGADWLTQSATGFLVGGAHDGVKNETLEGRLQQRMDDLDDMIMTTGTAFLGLTVNCARCHDHKFDPIMQRDYYGLQAIFSGVQHHDREIPLIHSGTPSPLTLGPLMNVYAGRFVRPGSTHILVRGDPMQKREAVGPSGIASIQPPLVLDIKAPEVERRLALARWIAHPDNPLPARVMVNRVWHYHFGQGIVRTPSDFGFQGDRPSHPELLDWLAAEYMTPSIPALTKEGIQGGWRLKPLHKLIMLSATYRQSNRLDSDAMKVDGENRLLWRMNPRRLEAEAIRDSVLAVSGKLDLRVGGPGYNIWEKNTNYVVVFKPKTDLGPDEFRRMVYQFKPRSQNDPTFGSFDCPDASLVMPRRTHSTTALQALNLMNSRFIVSQADFFAERLRKEAGGDSANQVRRAFWLAFGRDPSEKESNAAVDLVQASGPAALGRALYNANEFLYVQ